MVVETRGPCKVSAEQLYAFSLLQSLLLRLLLLLFPSSCGTAGVTADTTSQSQPRGCQPLLCYAALRCSSKAEVPLFPMPAGRTTLEDRNGRTCPAQALARRQRPGLRGLTTQRMSPTARRATLRRADVSLSSPPAGGTCILGGAKTGSGPAGGKPEGRSRSRGRARPVVSEWDVAALQTAEKKHGALDWIRHSTQKMNERRVNAQPNG